MFLASWYLRNNLIIATLIYKDKTISEKITSMKIDLIAYFFCKSFYEFVFKNKQAKKTERLDFRSVRVTK